MIYHIGLNLTVVMLVVRGVTQVMGTNLSKGADAAISGMAGVGHILLGVSLALLLLQSGATWWRPSPELRNKKQ